MESGLDTLNVPGQRRRVEPDAAASMAACRLSVGFTSGQVGPAGVVEEVVVAGAAVVSASTQAPAVSPGRRCAFLFFLVTESVWPPRQMVTFFFFFGLAAAPSGWACTATPQPGAGQPGEDAAATGHAPQPLDQKVECRAVHCVLTIRNRHQPVLLPMLRSIPDGWGAVYGGKCVVGGGGVRNSRWRWGAGG